MNFTFDDDQELLRQTARDFLAQECPPSLVRAALADRPGVVARLWPKLAAMGWLGLGVPERTGGAGLDAVSQMIVLEESGRALLPVPYWSTAFLGAQLLATLGDSAGVLPRVVGGETRLTVALSEFWRDQAPIDLTTTVRRASGPGEATARPTPSPAGNLAGPRDDDLRLDGLKTFVTDADAADVLLVVADFGGQPAVAVVPRDAPGLGIESLAALDRTRPVFAVRLDGVPVDAITPEAGADELDRALAGPTVGLCAELVGCAGRALDLTVAYAKERQQFGRPIGSFQAVKHQAADMLVALEAARVATHYAATTLDHELDEAGADGGASRRRAVALAKAVASEHCWRVTAQAIQLHGGIGFTWEHDLHLYFKRARVAASLLGDARWHYDALADAVLPAPAASG